MTTDPEQLLSIGELSRASGLTVSALRFYDGAQVLTPAWVDSWSGYRRYSPGQVLEARILAGMRRVQMPVAEMAATLEALRQGDLDSARDLLSAHLRRLEEGLDDARRQLAQLHHALAEPMFGKAMAGGPPSQVAAPTLLALLAAVRHAVGTDPQLPALMSVLVEVGEELTVVATDRFRMVVAGRWHRAGAAEPQVGSVLLPTGEVDRLTTWLSGRHGSLTLAAQEELLVVRSGEEELRLTGLDEAYPDYRRVLEHGVQLRPLPTEQLHAALDGDDVAVNLGGVLVDRGFLWDAVSNVPDGQVLLPADGVIAPLVVRSPGDLDVVALVMPLAPERS
ncbi:MerR family transcriptional regulator [Ornithinimicrobium pratense]|uniref:MerR family DNA-binding transcriptional regulator n=1 Tax=Ornithinimicrobium pratense TaxID=2593973 RepID=A0A5J6V5L2_9MICO|nr:MerR family transcriptional regulator [Ornithinimicrobium pratense]QFG69065.1 MerR family DNA-binding transcriptional regulator [Ornithinimicrobium pratense]